jgi:hypothetical protein
MSPPETAMLAQILVASGVLFFIAYVGNRLSFSNRFANALVTALIFAVFYGVLAYTVDTTVLPPELKEASRQAWLQIILTAASLVFVLDLVANLIHSPSARLSKFPERALPLVLGPAITARLWTDQVLTSDDPGRHVIGYRKAAPLSIWNSDAGPLRQARTMPPARAQGMRFRLPPETHTKCDPRTCHSPYQGPGVPREPR